MQDIPPDDASYRPPFIRVCPISQDEERSVAAHGQSGKAASRRWGANVGGTVHEFAEISSRDKDIRHVTIPKILYLNCSTGASDYHL